ncbi:MAG: hypothetical protein AMXMBFR53_30140 [Gemmatimonadota bacterium]
MSSDKVVRGYRHKANLASYTEVHPMSHPGMVDGLPVVVVPADLWERVERALRKAESAATYAAATVSPGNLIENGNAEWPGIHRGRADSSMCQLDAVRKEIRAILGEAP